MHHKVSEPQIARESSAVSSGFLPRPALLSSATPTPTAAAAATPQPQPLLARHPHQSHDDDSQFPKSAGPSPNCSPSAPTSTVPDVDAHDAAAAEARRLQMSASDIATQHKRPRRFFFLTNRTGAGSASGSQRPFRLRRVPISFSAVHRLIRPISLRFRLLLLFSFPSVYFLLSSSSSSSFVPLLLAFLAALALSCAILVVIVFSFSFPKSAPITSILHLGKVSRYALILRKGRPFLLSLKKHYASSTGPPPPPELTVEVYANGDVYQGEEPSHYIRGPSSTAAASTSQASCGVYHYGSSGGRFEGEWREGAYDGFGVETWPKGSCYRGQYRKGLRHGLGSYKFHTGDVYAGEWEEGQSHGCGVHTCGDGSRYVGQFRKGAKHGLGRYHFRNGDTYAGEYSGDKMHGFGIYTFANGHRYEGAWQEGKRHGLGTYTFRNGEAQPGDWRNGVLVTPSTQQAFLVPSAATTASSCSSPSASCTVPASSPIAVAVNHSKVLNAVQEARSAAERAFDVPRVDDRLNKAVAAANRAANAARMAAMKAVQRRPPLCSSSSQDNIPAILMV